MAEEKRVNDAEGFARSQQRLVQGNVPVLDPDHRCNSDQYWQKLDPRMEGTVKRLIAHLKDEKKPA